MISTASRATRLDRANKRGFTLIELSIVLVIIGLIVGGVLVGRDLVRAAEVRSQITQIQDLETQIVTFRGKYECLPGDCLNVTNFLGSAYRGFTITNGDGNGLICAGGQTDRCALPDVSLEVTQLFFQLNASSLGAYTSDGASGVIGVGIPYAAINNGTGMFISVISSSNSYQQAIVPAFAGSNNMIVIGGSNQGGPNPRIGYRMGLLGVSDYGGYGNSNSGALSPIGIPVAVTQNIDRKMDDAMPESGKFGVLMGPSTNCITGGVYPAATVICNVTAGKTLSIGG